NKALLRDTGADPTPLEAKADDYRSKGQGVMFVGIDGNLAGLLVVADPVKESAASAVKALHDAGVRLVMMTGDNMLTANAVAAEVGGIDEVFAEVPPQDKQAKVQQLRNEGRRVAMASDGIKDAPALAAADVGIAMGAGTDVRVESAAVTLVKGDLTGIVRARYLSRAVMRNIRENLFLSFVSKADGWPTGGGTPQP